LDVGKIKVYALLTEDSPDPVINDVEGGRPRVLSYALTLQWCPPEVVVSAKECFILVTMFVFILLSRGLSRVSAPKPSKNTLCSLYTIPQT